MNNLHNLKVVFFGTSDFAIPIFHALHENTKLLGLVTQPDKPVGRRQELQSPAILQKYQNRDPQLKIFQFESLRDPAAIDVLRSLDADLFVVAAYGKIIPQSILSLPRKGCINVHGSILPQYRGASPIQAALLNGDEFTGNTIMLMDEQMDHGPLLATSKIPIDPHDDQKSLEIRMAQDGAKLLIQTLPGYLDGSLQPVAQEHGEASYVKIIAKEDGQIDWKKSAAEIYNQYRAFRYWPGIFTYLPLRGAKLRLKIDEISVLDEHIEEGKITFHSDCIAIGASRGSIGVLRATIEGKKSMTAQELMNGFPELNGAHCL